MNGKVNTGSSYPLGSTLRPGGANFSVYAKNATSVELLLFDAADDDIPSRIVPLDPLRHRTFHYWHIYAPDIQAGQLYGYRVNGPNNPERGLRFDPEKLLLDPYARGVAAGTNYDRQAACRPGVNWGAAMKSVVVDYRGYNWEGDAPLRKPFRGTVIYEMHVRGFTQHASSGVAAGKRGTYAGVIEKIPYLKDLGVTAVELLPVFQFDPQDAPPGLSNYWGYSPVSFFAPHCGYSSDSAPLAAIAEFRDMVKALHRAGIEVILDVVFNHTAEGDQRGPMFCFKGLANDVYYILDPQNGAYTNYAGTGNTLKANHSVVRRLILDSLRYWVTEMHVDGFRFDLASILSRDEEGRPFPNPPILWDIETDPVLSGSKLIAEAWDAAGLYQVGCFIGDFWKEWNGQFRDDIRDFWRAAPGSVAKLPNRLFASPDIFAAERREPETSVNFVTCHDGFTLYDLVSYNVKHNEANREGNRDGCDNNLSWNCGAEGPTDSGDINRLRKRQIKNFLALTLLSAGTPMLTMGDEVCRSQWGNNNAYCQDNELSWLDWSLRDKHADIHRFVKLLIELRGLLYTWKESQATLNLFFQQLYIEYHGVKLHQPDWGRDSHGLAILIAKLQRPYLIYFIFNSYWESLAFELPRSYQNAPLQWARVIDTALASPDDCVGAEAAVAVGEFVYRAQARSTVMLLAKI
ncbi:glycogen debranching protein GlgX [Methylomonas sp. MS20]|uniref:glycogen debranching protein GlgX n=1 Tax=unclassified Methylomonas TaxID=2608980 RepID=UPI0028A3FF99|nr:glycogen debranching protein GlgX [Methylomonas sp. MV1]MDT4331389.1 glycogen debranching protein GlgX [Methylomonas sp. MV1]